MKWFCFKEHYYEKRMDPNGLTIMALNHINLVEQAFSSNHFILQNKNSTFICKQLMIYPCDILHQN